MILRSIPPIACVAALALSGCAPMPPTNAAPPAAAAGCNAEAARWAIGQAVSDEVVERVRVDTGSRSTRVIHPGQAVTMDYRFDRVNIHVNERGAITGVTCG